MDIFDAFNDKLYLGVLCPKCNKDHLHISMTQKSAVIKCDYCEKTYFYRRVPNGFR